MEVSQYPNNKYLKIKGIKWYDYIKKLILFDGFIKEKDLKK